MKANDSCTAYLRWDCDYYKLHSDINTYEMGGIINSDQAWYLRETYLRVARSPILVIDFTVFAEHDKGYSGSNANNISIVYNDEVYMLKFPPLRTKKK